MALTSELELLVITPQWWYEGTQYVKAWAGHLARRGRALVRPLFTFATGKQYAHWYPQLASAIRVWSPDIIHVEEEPMSLACAQTALIRSWKAPNAHFLFFTWENVHQRWLLPNLRAIAYPLFERICYRAANLAIAGTQSAKRILLERGFTKPIAVCPQFGINVRQFTPLPQERRARMRKQYALPPLNKALAIGYIGRLIPEKGVDLLIRAIARFPNMHLIIVGDGPERVILTKLSYALGVATRIQFLGALAHECLPKLLNALDVVVLPSRSTSHWQEQFGRALVEAMACGIPVIGSSCGAIPEVIGDAGLIFQEGNLESLCTALKRVAEDSMLRHSLGLKARKRAMDVFDENVVARITLDVYNQLTA